MMWPIVWIASTAVVMWGAYCLGYSTRGADEHVAKDRADALSEAQHEVEALSERMEGRASNEYRQGLHDAQCILGRAWARELAGEAGEACMPSVTEERPWLRSGHVLR